MSSLFTSQKLRRWAAALVIVVLLAVSASPASVEARSSGRAVAFVVVAVVVAVFAPLAITTAFGGVFSATAIFGAAATGVACATRVICNPNPSSGGGGGGGGAPARACSSAPNSCGQTNSGFIVGGSCNATPPPNSACPAPAIPPSNGFYATPLIVGTGKSSTLTWNATNSTACTITGDNGFSNTGASSGSVSTGALAATATFTLTCSNGAGGPQTSKSVKVIVDPHYKEI